MNRGIRQGDPASGYLFNLAVEPLANHIKKSSLIKGIKINNAELRLSQYADDLIIFLSNQSQSINNIIPAVQEYSSVSGLHLNVDKTKCLQIGTPTHSQENVHTIQYVNELKILGISFQNKMEQITSNNLGPKLLGIEKDILQWNRRSITLLGKITVIKSLLLSKLVHIFLALPSPSDIEIKKIEKLLFRFFVGRQA